MKKVLSSLCIVLIALCFSGCNTKQTKIISIKDKHNATSYNSLYVYYIDSVGVIGANKNLEDGLIEKYENSCGFDSFVNKYFVSDMPSMNNLMVSKDVSIPIVGTVHSDVVYTCQYNIVLVKEYPLSIENHKDDILVNGYLFSGIKVADVASTKDNFSSCDSLQEIEKMIYQFSDTLTNDVIIVY